MLNHLSTVYYRMNNPVDMSELPERSLNEEDNEVSSGEGHDGNVLRRYFPETWIFESKNAG